MLPATDPAPDADLLRIPVGPGSMHVDRYGHGGTPIVLLHGFGTSCFLWRTVGPALASARHTAYGVDLFGYGESDRPFDAEFGIAAQAEYLDRALTAPILVAGIAQWQLDIGNRRLPGEQVEALKNESHLAVTDVRQLVAYVKEQTGKEGSLEIHLAWEIFLTNTPVKTVYLDAISDEIIATK